MLTIDFYQPTLLMPIIQYVLPSKNKQLKKLLHFYWEVCPKYDENGKLKQEMILVVWVFNNHSSLCYIILTLSL
jgi:coatomer subunit beta